VEKYGRDRQDTGENIIRPMLFSCRITTARIEGHSNNI
jgi:hypothetical protein